MHTITRHSILALAMGAALTLGIAQPQTQTPPPPNAPQLSVRDIYDHVEALEYAQVHWLAGGMLVFSFLVLLVLYSFNARPRAC